MTKKILNANFDTTTIQVELSSSTLKNLLSSGLLHGGDCKCLNSNAKQVLWQAILATSTNSKQYADNELFA